ncbi:MBL fold metallo-hydrolase [Flavobacterium sp. I3-2]|uniref:MBL fold metallo-hydrolase n=1 Tax=Flavobacterium sp. I3-2 TaxID=2748319 RepID=UPI0021062235|nr:MBL fold metallo-hydrolase [Flavobacterium sp. I3-2]
MKQKTRKRIRKMLYIFLFLIVGLTIGTVVFLQHPLFGKTPSRDRLKKVENSENYSDGKFQNLSETPDLTEGVSYTDIFKDMLFNKAEHAIPLDSIPSEKTNLIDRDTTENFIVWFGHSSYFMQIDGKKYLIDPVLTENASPIYGTNNAFKGATNYTFEDLPEIDFLLITHDHYDHLDYTTIKNIKSKVKQIVCPLGVGEHFEFWGFDASKIIEKDWYENYEIDAETLIMFTPARHFSGRGFKRNQSLWTSYVLKTKNFNLYLGGDSGYDFHFKEIGEKYGPFDLVILENGQYDYKWKYIHMQPDEVLKASKDLQAKRLFPVHSAKFKLANHAWKEPLEKITTLNDAAFVVPIITPKIGSLIDLNNPNQKFDYWWKTVE